MHHDNNIRDLYERNLIIVTFIPNVDIVADSLTKPFIKNKYKTFKQQLDITINRNLVDRLG